MIKLKETIPDSPEQRNVLLFVFKEHPEEFLKDYSFEELEKGLKDLKKYRTKAKSGMGKSLYDVNIVYLDRYIKIRKRETA